MAANFAVRVVFRERGVWSKNYTYQCAFRPEVGDKVVVPAGDWYSVAKVVSVFNGESYDWKEGITYKEILQRLVM